MTRPAFSALKRAITDPQLIPGTQVPRGAGDTTGSATSPTTELSDGVENVQAVLARLTCITSPTCTWTVCPLSGSPMPNSPEAWLEVDPQAATLPSTVHATIDTSVLVID